MMKVLLTALAFVAPVAAVAQVRQDQDELRALARHGSDSALVQRVRQQPDVARKAWRELMAGATGGSSDSAQAVSLAAADRVAGAVAVAWRDSFLLRQVARFRSLSPSQRLTTVEADSVWEAGQEAFGAQGSEVAMRIVREALGRFEALADTSGIAAALGAVAVGFHYAQEYDSAVAYLTRAEGYARRIGDLRVRGSLLRLLGNARWRQGDLPGANESFVSARKLFERIGDAEGLRSMYNSTGLVAWTAGDLVAARRDFEAGLALSRKARDVRSTTLYLSNLGGVTAEAGNYAEATVLLQEAISIYRAEKEWLEVAATLRNLGEVTMRRGDYHGAIAAFSEALGIMRRLGAGAVIHHIDEIDVRSELARARALMGDLQGARAELERAEAFANRLGGVEHRASVVELALTGGDLALKFNRLGEAERQYARARRLARGEATYQKRSQAEIGLASVLLRRESYRRAQITLEQALSRRSLDSHLTAMIRLMLAQASWRGGDSATARRAFSQALDTLRAVGAVADEAQALGQLAEFEGKTGRPLAAESLYQRGLRRLGARPAPAVAWQLHAGLGRSLRSRGALADATRELHAGIAEIERVSGNLQLEEHRSAFHADKWGVYVDLALVEHTRGRTEAAFEASERLRGRQMLDLLARGRVGEGASLRELSTREQDLRRKIGELAIQPESPKPGEPDAQVMRDPASAGDAVNPAAKELARLQEDYSRLLLEIREANPAYAALVRGETVRARAVMDALAPEEALLEYLVGDSTTLVFIVTRDTIAAVDLKLGHHALAAQVDFARSRLASPKGDTGRRAWRPPLRRLYQQLVGPVEASGLLAGKQRLLIAPHAELHYLPFAALVRSGPPNQLLIEQYLIDYVPSASVWLRLRDRSQPAKGGGILALAPRAKALPGSRAEVGAIRRIYGDQAQTFVGTPATEGSFRAHAPEREIVHLATYGVLNKHNPLFSYVELGKSPNEDGRLEVHEVFGLNLKARLLVLSACQTGLAAGALADVPPGDDWVGLVQGFLYAGAGNVLATLWPVADIATARLMERFYRELAAGRSEVEALALTQRAAMRDPEMAHPFYWAGFTLVRGH